MEPHVLRLRDFGRFQLARLLAIIGSQMVSVAVGWRVYALTGQALDLGYVGLAQFLPFLTLATVGGQIADRFDRRAVVIVAWSVHACATASLGWLALSPTADVWPIYGVLVLLGASRAFSAPASTALLPHLVPRDRLTQAIAWSSTVFQVATVMGPAVGGLVYGLCRHASPVFLGAAGLEGLAILLVLSLHVRTGALEQKAFTFASLAGGFRFVWRQKLLLGCISLDLFAVLLGGAVALLPVYAKDVLHVGPEGLGLMRSAPAAGASVMALLLARWPLQRRAGPRLLWAVLVFGIATVVFGLSTSFPLSLSMLFTLGAADMVSVVVRMTVEQLATPHEMRGRVSAVNQMFIGASNELGAFESGVTAQLLGTVPAVVVGGLGTCAVVALWALLFPSLRNVDRLDDLQP